MCYLSSSYFSTSSSSAGPRSHSAFHITPWHYCDILSLSLSLFPPRPARTRSCLHYSKHPNHRILTTILLRPFKHLTLSHLNNIYDVWCLYKCNHQGSCVSKLVFHIFPLLFFNPKIFKFTNYRILFKLMYRIRKTYYIYHKCTKMSQIT